MYGFAFGVSGLGFTIWGGALSTFLFQQAQGSSVGAFIIRVGCWGTSYSIYIYSGTLNNRISNYIYI